MIREILNIGLYIVDMVGMEEDEWLISHFFYSFIVRILKRKSARIWISLIEQIFFT